MMHLRERESLSSVCFLLLLYLYFYPYTFDCTCPYFNFIHWSKYNLCTSSFSILVLALLELYLFLRSCSLVLLYSSASSFSFLTLHCCTRHLRHITPMPHQFSEEMDERKIFSKNVLFVLKHTHYLCVLNDFSTNMHVSCVNTTLTIS